MSCRWEGGGEADRRSVPASSGASIAPLSLGGGDRDCGTTVVGVVLPVSPFCTSPSPAELL